MTVPAVDPIPDTLVTPIAQDLLECLCQALAASIGGPTCQCCLRPGGGLPPADACCKCGDGQGQASVQVGPVFPYAAGRFPSAGLNPEDITPCGSTGGWAVELQLVVYRCVSCADEDGFPSCEELEYDSRKILSDGAAMRRAVLCCDWRPMDDDEPRAIVPGRWEQIPPMGCCAGSRMTVTVDLGQACCP